ncbi:MAG: stage III sporulation protein AD [bacterium]
MIILKIVGISIIASIFILVIKQEKPELAFLLTIITGLVIMIMVIEQLGELISILYELAQRSEIDGVYFNTIMKIIGLAYIGEFGAEITRDAGEKALASKIEMAVKIIIMFMALPMMVSLIETILEFLPQ